MEKNIKDNSVSATIRVLTDSEAEAALHLAWDVFCEYEAPEYGPEGTEEFRKTLNDRSYLAALRYYGAFDGTRLIGVLAYMESDTHICFFFVDSEYQRKGVGRTLFNRLAEEHPGKTVTLNSAPYGLPFYRRLGFTETAEEQTVNGIRFTSMEYSPK